MEWLSSTGKQARDPTVRLEIFAGGAVEGRNGFSLALRELAEAKRRGLRPEMPRKVSVAAARIRVKPVSDLPGSHFHLFDVSQFPIPRAMNLPTAVRSGWAPPNKLLHPGLSVADRHRIARDAAAFLRGAGAARVWLFGSLARGGEQDWRSDLDLATEGLPPERYLACLGELLIRIPVAVDLVEMEKAPPALREQILATRILLSDDD